MRHIMLFVAFLLVPLFGVSQENGALGQLKRNRGVELRESEMKKFDVTYLTTFRGVTLREAAALESLFRGSFKGDSVWIDLNVSESAPRWYPYTINTGEYYLQFVPDNGGDSLYIGRGWLK